MSLNPSQELLLNRINENRALLGRDEAFDFYVDHVMRDDAGCKLVYTHQGVKPRDYYLWEIEQKAMQWYRIALGSLALKGALKIVLD